MLLIPVPVALLSFVLNLSPCPLGCMRLRKSLLATTQAGGSARVPPAGAGAEPTSGTHLDACRGAALRVDASAVPLKRRLEWPTQSVQARWVRACWDWACRRWQAVAVCSGGLARGATGGRAGTAGVSHLPAAVLDVRLWVVQHLGLLLQRGVK